MIGVAKQTRWLFALLVVVQLVLLTLQVPDPAGRGSRLEVLVLRAVAPLARLVAQAADGVAQIGHGLATAGRLRNENRRLRREVARLEREVVRLAGVEEDLARLGEALGYAREGALPVRVADIVYLDHFSWLQTLLLYVGDEGARIDQPVVAADGLVGRVVLVAGPYAKVQLVTDRTASVGAMIERTRRQGVAQGVGGGSLELDFVPAQSDVRRGDRVVTAGIDGVYPRGIPLGRVTSVEPGSDLFHRIRLAPAVDFGLLDQVYLVEREAPPANLRRAEGDARR